jgi:3-phosphoinositide dependent protein kinase-1
MQALRTHPFFSSIHWNTLWADPAPPLQAGLVKKERPLAGDGTGQNWADMGAVWDELVGCELRDTDEIAWASDGEGPRYELINNNKQNGHASKGVREEGPMGEVPRYNNNPDRFTFPMNDVKNLDQDWEDRGGNPQKVVSRNSFAGSGSSSEESPVERVGAVLESATVKRGRDPALTPIQGNNPPDCPWYVCDPHTNQYFRSQLFFC